MRGKSAEKRGLDLKNEAEAILIKRMEIIIVIYRECLPSSKDHMALLGKLILGR